VHLGRRQAAISVSSSRISAAPGVVEAGDQFDRLGDALEVGANWP
jgi:hypothetical protein